MGRARFPAEWEYGFWKQVRAGLIVEEAAAAVGVSRRTGELFALRTDGPRIRRPLSSR